MGRIETDSVVRRPLNEILGAVSHVRLLRSLILHGGFMAAADLVRATGLSRESVRQGLSTLQALGTVEAAGSAHARVFRFSGNGPLAEALSALFEAEKSRFAAIVDSVRSAARDAKPVSLFLYGSAARGEDGVDSDLDICIVLPPAALSAELGTLRERLREPAERLGFLPAIVGLDPDDVRRLIATDDPWWKNAVRDAMLLDGLPPEDLDGRREARHGENRKDEAQG